MKIKRKIELFKIYFKMNLKCLAIYDKDFYFGIVSMIIKYMSGLMVIFFIFNLVDRINGWSLDQILFLYSFNLVGYSMWSCLFINTITLPYYIKNGELDNFLLRPVAPLFQIMMDGFDDDAWGELITGLIILIYAWIKLKISIYYIFAMPLLLISSCLIYAGISIMISTISFFTIAQTEFINLTMEVKEFAKYPITIYKKGMQLIFTTIIPIGLSAYYPSQVMMGISQNIYLIFLIPILSLLYYQISKIIWNFGLKKYGSTGS